MKITIGHFFRYQFPAIAWAIVIFFVSSIPGSKLPKLSRMINDKIMHASIFFVLGLLVYRALQPRAKSTSFDWRRVMISVVAVVMYGITDEFHQGLVPGRTVDVLDATADSVGGICSAIVVYLFYRRKSSDLGANS